MWSLLAKNAQIDTKDWTTKRGEPHFWPDGPPPASARWELLHLPSKTVYRFATPALVAAALGCLELSDPHPTTVSAVYALAAGRVPKKYRKMMDEVWVRKIRQFQIQINQ